MSAPPSTPSLRTPEEVQARESHALALDALDAIQRVKTPEEAESLLARVKVAAEAARVMHLGKALSREWRSIEIKAERKWGELLGEAKAGGTGANQHSSVTDRNEAPPAERKAAHEARKLAAVPGPIFEQYVEATETPTKAGLLRAAADTQSAQEPPVETAPKLGKRQEYIANAARDRIDKAMHRLDGMCAALSEIDPLQATSTTTEGQIAEWQATADRARSNLRQFTALLRRAT